ncbi:MAG: uroporphyrinogen-III decarboxylase-like protein [Chloroflexi bacterium]|nr:uroporphyrinogen-III decarboxylase-like protein [Chloroflexota bacterium]
MDHRERILAAMRHQPVDRVPTDMWATVEVQEALFDHFGIDAGWGEFSCGVGLMGGALTRSVAAIIELWDRLHIDGILAVAPPYVGPPLRREGGITYSEWGFGVRTQEYGRGEYAEQVVWPLAEAETIEDLEAYRWPDPDWYDYDAVREIALQCEGRAVAGGYSAPFFWHNMLRGLERSLMDPLVKPEFTRHLIWRVSDFFTEYHRRLFEAAGDLIDVTQVTDDFGSQHGLLISPRMFDAFYREPMQRGIDLARRYGIIVFHHDDGDCRPLLPRFVEMGVQVLNPIQWRCGDWDLAALKADFGQDLCFHGAVDNQLTLPFGTPDDVRNEVRMLIDTLASDGTGFIIGPCHNLQIVSPIENIVALYEAATEYGAG